MSDLKVTGAVYAGSNESKVDASAKATEKKGADAATKNEEKKATENAGVVYEKGETPKKATYTINKMSAEERAALVQKLKADDEARRSQLSTLVSEMLSKQGNVSNLAQLFKPENLQNVTMADILQAKEDISEDGYWGVKQTSQRLFDFASALAGDDVEKMKEMQAAMEKGFKMATKSWGEDLPGICKDTIDAANKLFDEYYASKNAVEE